MESLVSTVKIQAWFASISQPSLTNERLPQPARDRTAEHNSLRPLCPTPGGRRPTNPTPTFGAWLFGVRIGRTADSSALLAAVIQLDRRLQQPNHSYPGHDGYRRRHA